MRRTTATSQRRGSRASVACLRLGNVTDDEPAKASRLCATACYVTGRCISRDPGRPGRVMEPMAPHLPVAIPAWFDRRCARCSRSSGGSAAPDSGPRATSLVLVLHRVSTAFENGTLPGQKFQGSKGDGDPLLHKAAPIRGYIRLSQMPGDPTPRWVKEPLPEQTHRISHRRGGPVPPGVHSAERIRKTSPPLSPHQPPVIIASFGKRRTGEPSQHERTHELVCRQDGLTFLGGEWPLIDPVERPEMGDRILPRVLQRLDYPATVRASTHGHRPLPNPPHPTTSPTLPRPITRNRLKPVTLTHIAEIDPPHQHGRHSRLGPAHNLGAVHPSRCRIAGPPNNLLARVGTTCLQPEPNLSSGTPRLRSRLREMCGPAHVLAG